MSSCREPGCQFVKDPDSIEPFGFDWTLWLADISTGESIVTSTWAVAPAGLTLSSPSIVTGSLKTQVKVADGDVGVKYLLTNSITTSGGFQDDRSFYILVRER